MPDALIASVIFPGTIIAGLDLVVYAIPTIDATFGGEYEEYSPIDAFGQTWHVLEWNNSHNVFIVTDPQFADLLAGEPGKLALFEFCQQAWGEPPESDMPATITQTYQPRLM